MTDVRVDRTVGRRTSTHLPATRAVLVALAVALSVGAVACAARLAAGHAHGPAAVAADAVDEIGTSSAAHHALHVGGSADVPPGAPALAAAANHGDRGRHAGGTSSGEAHPGMACIVSVDLHVPEPTAELVGVRCETADVVVGSEWADDLDPPVPRLS